MNMHNISLSDCMSLHAEGGIHVIITPHNSVDKNNSASLSMCTYKGNDSYLSKKKRGK